MNTIVVSGPAHRGSYLMNVINISNFLHFYFFIPESARPFYKCVTGFGKLISVMAAMEL